MNWETLLCLGDSITIGARSYLAYPEYTGHYLSKAIGNSWNVINESVSGFTTIDLARHLSEKAVGIKPSAPDFFTLMIGTNDLKGGTSIENFTIAYEQVILKAKLLCSHKKGILLEIPKLQVGIKFPYKIDMNNLREEFNAIIHKLGKRHTLDVLKLNLQKEHFFDGVHLNESGSKHTAIQLANYILAERGMHQI